MTTPSAPALVNGRIQTRFGEFNLVRPEIVSFPEGIPGFEQCRRFVVILADELSPLTCLQALDDPYPSFLASAPATLRADYRPELPDADRLKLRVHSNDPVLWLVIVTIGRGEVCANLKAPIAINARAMLGRQVVLDDDLPVAWQIESR